MRAIYIKRTIARKIVNTKPNAPINRDIPNIKNVGARSLVITSM